LLVGAAGISGYWEEFLPARMVSLAGDLPESERFDAIVVDEGQHFAESWWDADLAPLRDPEVGALYVFSDEGGQRIFARQGRPSVGLQSFSLTDNLRNTKQIAGTFSSLAPRVNVCRLSGVPVRFVPCTSEQAVDVADDLAASLLEDEDWPPESVALLTTHQRHPVQTERQVQGQDAYWDTFETTRTSSTGTCSGSRGSSGRRGCSPSTAFATRPAPGGCSTSACFAPRDLLVVCGDMDLIRRVGSEGVAQRLMTAATK
jgi:hypothetical protein